MRILYLLVFVTLFILITWFYFYTDHFSKPNFGTYINCLSVIGITISLLTFIHIKSNGEKEILRNEKIDALTAVNRGYTEIEKLFLQNYPWSCQFYNEIYQTTYNSSICGFKSEIITDPQRQNMVNEHIGSVMIQSIEEVLLSSRLHDHKIIDLSDWIKTWRQWFRSGILRKIWICKRSLYNHEMQSFIDSLIQQSA